MTTDGAVHPKQAASLTDAPFVGSREPRAATATFTRLESNVRSYARSFPVVFSHAAGPFLYEQHGNRYIDFLCGAGSLNYGHNHPALSDRLVTYILEGGIAHSLDLHTAAKAEFLQTFQAVILEPRGLDYVAQFPGPTGANAVEAALKLARKLTGRHNVIAFTNGFHGVSLGALAATGNNHHRSAAGVPLQHVYHAPFDGYLGPDVDTIAVLAKLLRDPASGVDRPAAVIVETVQGEGGLNVAGEEWLRRLEALCREERIVLIVDDIQAGCGRTGTFFSFERAGIRPDVVTLSKSLSGFGLPMSLTLIQRELDCWEPGEHNGTFRGNNHAFVTATEALKTFWMCSEFEESVMRKVDSLTCALDDIARSRGQGLLGRKGCGLMQGLACVNGELAAAVKRAAFRSGLIVETSGPHDDVVKCLPPLTTPPEVMTQAFEILADAVAQAVGEYASSCE